jgi:membrane-associated phospholipid phosphatase
MPSPETDTSVPARRVLARSLWARVRRGLPETPLPRGWRDAVLQLALWGLADLLYEGVRGIVVGQQSVALANANWIVSAEKATGIFVEPTIQHWFIGDRSLIDVTNYVYGNAQFTVNALFLACIYMYRNDIFYFVRNMFFVSMAIALIVHLSLPVAPPRMLPQFGFVDTIQQFAHINQDAGAISLFVNPYAAVPSMHVCFALLVGVTGFSLARRLWLKAICVLYPLLILFAIVVSANHFFLDAVAGAMTAGGAFLVANYVMSRLRPHQWAWVRAPSTERATAPAPIEAEMIDSTAVGGRRARARSLAATGRDASWRRALLSATWTELTSHSNRDVDHVRIQWLTRDLHGPARALAQLAA